MSIVFILEVFKKRLIEMQVCEGLASSIDRMVVCISSKYRQEGQSGLVSARRISAGGESLPFESKRQERAKHIVQELRTACGCQGIGHKLHKQLIQPCLMFSFHAACGIARLQSWGKSIPHSSRASP